MKKLLLISLLIGALPLGMEAQDDDLYFVPKKKSVEKTVGDDWSQGRQVYYSGSDRSVDEYNRRGSYYEVIGGDSTATDIIDFSAEKGVYPDSLTAEDFKLAKRMNRFDDYELREDSAYWAGYRDGRYDWGWHSPWYYSRYGWYDPWYWDSWYGWYDPWYYGYHGWGYPYYGWGYYYGWRPYYDWYYPHHYTVYVGGGGRVGPRRSNTGTINHYAGTMSGRNYGSRTYASNSNYRGRTSVSRLGASRQSSLRSRGMTGHSAYNRSTSSGSYNSSRSVSDHSAYQRSSSTGSYTRSSSGYSGGGFSGGGGSRGGGGFSGGGGSRGGGHVGGRR